MYSVIIDDDLGGSAGPQERADRRFAVDHWLNTPLDPDEATEYERETWGTSPEALREAAAKDEYFDDATYGLPA